MGCSWAPDTDAEPCLVSATNKKTRRQGARGLGGPPALTITVKESTTKVKVPRTLLEDKLRMISTSPVSSEALL
ncbi:hypothetical protein PF005_g27049 [Phytophthora fragariae]|nr:hypothetical protein PF003_g3378 [Phytophthora fragariae]KAE8925744.1 hypothetical protein PF009_g24052 [Phytophthora fragariae]KAE8971221.1 hypothetical protein PF011_g26113 [Phytophthora fragariae]KAE9069878.1 hypothetical protein PF007_g27150 [Phytophthora fragariae]KAE9079818.1 hypothetical protein PF010_g22612 [Phytophthora fragariae]